MAYFTPEKKADRHRGIHGLRGPENSFGIIFRNKTGPRCVVDQERETTMKTKTSISVKKFRNSLKSGSSLILSLVTAALISLLFIELADKVDTGIDLALLTQQTYKIHFFG